MKMVIIRNPNADEAHSMDNISTRFIQLSGKEVVLPLKLLFKSILEEGIFPENWKIYIAVPIKNQNK